MEKFTVGSVVLVAFPFSNLKGKKIRPALILACVEFDNLILCQITSKPYSSKSAIRIESADFAEGRLPVVSYVRPDKLFTADGSIIEKAAGKLKPKNTNTILQEVRSLFSPIQ
jgi:mRNA interferase MazF